ncbi:MAG: hypothetical protein BMS9Abin29_2228 [Gemmatimonadota bacterium]|nr:MAG: hypothetical protein BMS9Abin29_2228 [Gemmatimonadota bacterium]
MQCSDFLAGFSDFYDASDGSPERTAAIAHMAECDACTRYNEVVERGIELLRSIPSKELGESFRPRLEHRLFHLADEAALGRGGSASGTTVATAVWMAMLLAAVAWAPSLKKPVPEVELQPIVVSEPPARAGTSSVSATMFFQTNPFAPRRDMSSEEMWSSSLTLLWEYSPLKRKYQDSGLLRRTGLD